MSASSISCVHPDSIAVDGSWTVRIVADVRALAGTSIVNIGQVTGGNEVNGVDPLTPGIPTSVQDSSSVTVDSPPGILAFTGTDSGKLALAALALLSLGAGMVMISRRKRVV